MIGWATRIPSAIRLQWLKVVCKIYIDVFSFLRSSWEAFKYNWMITRITFLRSLFYFPSSSRSANWMTHHYLRDLPFSYSFSFLRQPSWISYDRWSVVLIIKLSKKNVFKQKQKYFSHKSFQTKSRQWSKYLNVSQVLTEFGNGWVYELSKSGYFTKVCPKIVYQTERIANIHKILFFTRSLYEHTMECIKFMKEYSFI